MKASRIIVGLAALLATTGVALAASNAPSTTKSPASPAGVPNLYAPYAQAIAVVDQAGVPVSGKGWASITHPAVGITCLQLAAGIQLKTAPIVTVEWAKSLGVALFAQWDSASISCPSPTAGTIEVRTYKGDTGGVGSALQVPVLSDQVAFIVVVP